MKYNIIITSLLPLAILSACSHKEKSTNHTKVVKVETLTIEGTGYNNSTTYSGTIEEGESAVLSFSAAGTIKKLNIKQGQHVSQGQLIGSLDNSSLQSAYEIAQATLAQAQDAYNRMKILHDANSLPEIKWVDVQQKLVQAQNAVDIARNALNDANLYAPFSGVIAEKYADAGEVVAPAVPVAKLVNVGEVKAVISVPQDKVNDFAIGDKAMVSLNSNPTTHIEGTVAEKGVAANALSRAYDVKFIIRNNQSEFLPGMVCNVEVKGKTEKNTILLPQSVVLLDEYNNNFVWLDSAGIAKKRVVTVDNLSDGGLEITSGLSDGEKVVVKGIQKISNGMKIETATK